LSDLQAQIDELQAESDLTPVVVDANSEMLGLVVAADPPAGRLLPRVQFDLAGLPLFVVVVQAGEIRKAEGGSVFFESTDCTGTPWLEADAAAVWGTASTVSFSTGRLFYVSDPNETPQTLFLRSNFRPDGFCDMSLDQNISVREATVADLDSMFTPPFRVVTRGELPGSP
jgi:hypothetical protein